MARYIDADKLIETIFPIGLIDDGKYTINAKAIKMAIDSCPAADVAPKSEVERVYYNLQAVLEERAETKQEVAREIFEDIDLNLEDYMLGDISGRAMVSRLSQLKKKYTGGKE